MDRCSAIKRHYMSYTSPSEQHTHLADLIRIARSDGNVNIAETSLILWFVRRMGLTDGELERIAATPPYTYRPVRPEQRAHNFIDLLHVAAADGHIGPEEMEVVTELARQLGIRITMVEMILADVRSDHGRLPERDHLLAILLEA
jgi:tellurite resistance protein